MEQNEKGLMQWEKDFLISITILIIATIIAHIFFYQTAHNINVPMIYTLATFFISRYTKGYGWGIVSSLPNNSQYLPAVPDPHGMEVLCRQMIKTDPPYH